MIELVFIPGFDREYNTLIENFIVQETKNREQTI